MGKSTWSFGAESPMKFTIPDELANLYNEAVAQYFKAQEQFKRKHNRRWDPINDPILIDWTRKQSKAWNEFANIFNTVNAHDGPFHENDIMDDFLVKNAIVKGAQMAAKAIASPKRYIATAAFLGAAYALLRGYSAA
jgi:hypothetical protein